MCLYLAYVSHGDVTTVVYVLANSFTSTESLISQKVEGCISSIELVGDTGTDSEKLLIIK